MDDRFQQCFFVGVMVIKSGTAEVALTGNIGNRNRRVLFFSAIKPIMASCKACLVRVTRRSAGFFLLVPAPGGRTASKTVFEKLNPTPVR